MVEHSPKNPRKRGKCHHQANLRDVCFSAPHHQPRPPASQRRGGRGGDDELSGGGHPVPGHPRHLEQGRRPVANRMSRHYLAGLLSYLQPTLSFLPYPANVQPVYHLIYPSHDRNPHIYGLLGRSGNGAGQVRRIGGPGIGIWVLC